MGPRTQLDIGTRVTVYWPDDDQWCKGTVASAPRGDSSVRVEYDDGDTAWMDVLRDKWRRSTKPDVFLKHDTGTLDMRRKMIARLEVGSRISVWWPREKEYYTGTLTDILHEEDNKHPHQISYDDGDEEYTNLLFRNFKRVKVTAERLRVGSRVSVYIEQEDHRYFLSTVTKINPQKVRPHRVKYDDESRGKEWLNLNAHPFIEVEPLAAKSKDDPPAKVNALNLKKRKREFLVDPQPVDNTREGKQAKVEKEEDTTRTFSCEEVCGSCSCRLSAKRARAVSCHHIFCKRCAKAMNRCPICKFAITSERVKYDPEHPSFRAVEALERNTAEVALSFSSASAASLQSPPGTRVLPRRIIEACQSKRRDDREYKGYYWRFQGSKERILRAGEGVKDGLAVEQVDPQSGEILRIFPSSRKAQEETGISRGTIRRILERRGKATAGGFFWRFQGETHKPWPDPEPTHLKAVEQLDFETGDLLKSFASIAEAKRAMGMRTNSSRIGDVCYGIRATAQGYFWRWKGSQVLPNHMIGVQKILQIRKTKNGKVVKEFRTSREAQRYLGYQCCWSTICDFCRKKGFYNGYYWQYRMLKEHKSAEEGLVGKRLRVKQQPGDSGEWLEGKISSFHSETGMHEILFDCGTIKLCKLDDISYEWKNDQGQKPVEQLDLKTGQVLATFNSISEAAANLGSSGRTNHIGAVCAGRYKSCFGFFWRYKGSDALPPKPKGKRKVEQLCLKTGRVIATFDSISEAGRAFGITTPGISYCCNGRNNCKSAAGFGWRFSSAD